MRTRWLCTWGRVEDKHIGRGWNSVEVFVRTNEYIKIDVSCGIGK